MEHYTNDEQLYDDMVAGHLCDHVRAWSVHLHVRRKWREAQAAVCRLARNRN